MIVDVATFVGDYPYRWLPDTSPSFLLGEMDRIGIDEAWVGHLPSFLYRDPAPATARLVGTLAEHERLRPVPTIHPGLPGWSRDLAHAKDAAAPAVRAYPMHQGIDPAGGAMRDAVIGAAEAGVPLLLTVRLEDVRQRHALDTTPDLPPSAVRSLARADPRVRVLVTHAGREFIEEVHFGLTPDEARRVLWDITWVWGPPNNDLEALLTSVGTDRFTFGSSMPLRIPDAIPAKLDLTNLSNDARAGIESQNLSRWLHQ